MGAEFERQVDSIYLGGGTPTLLAPEQLKRLFAAVRPEFEVCPTLRLPLSARPAR